MLDELFIRFTDETGQEREIAITQPKFVIGRHSTADLSIPNGKLSREHLKIERLGDQLLVSDLGSSNGTQLNGQPLSEPVQITNGDRVDLGGGLIVEVVLRSFDPNAAADEEEEDGPDEDLAGAAPADGEAPAGPASNAGAEASGSGGFSWGWFVIAPILGIFLLVFVIGIAWVFIGGSSTEVAETNKGGYVYSHPEDDPSPEKTSTTSSPSGTTAGSSNNSSGTNIAQPSPANIGENGKVEQSAAAFLRRAALHDTTAFLTSEQAKKVSDKIKQIGSSSALADNINSARKNAAQIKSIATAKGISPQLLATAALTQLGDSRGDVLARAQSMSDILGKLQTQIGSELADDSLVMIAAYDQGERGDFQSLRNMLQDLTTKSPESARAIRSIWFLQKNGKISGSEFDFAIKFLAIGTITQSPKDFGINVDPLTL
ncbi:MAG TPA: FHA domain-containing protein [Pyrinomonadaceae bacterium]